MFLFVSLACPLLLSAATLDLAHNAGRFTTTALAVAAYLGVAAVRWFFVPTAQSHSPDRRAPVRLRQKTRHNPLIALIERTGLPSKFVLRMIVLVVGVLIVGASTHAQIIAAASDLQPVIDPLVRDFNTTHQTRATTAYGSTGKLTMQIESGAPFAVLFSADAKWMERAAKRAGGRKALRLGVGRLALVARAGSPVCSGGLGAIGAMAGPFAIAHPEHAPFGRAGKEVLERTRVWTALVQRKRVVMADSAASAAQWVGSGTAEAGLIGWTQASMLPKSSFCIQMVPTAQHSSLQMEVISLSATGDGFVRWVTRAENRRRFAQAGLTDE
jgi:molybdate transport system substrate-binding protein